MRISFSACKQAQPLVSFPGGFNMDPFDLNHRRRKEKVVVVMGATGTGKSRLSIDLATRFPAEIVNCDKMQVYKGLNIATNKVTEEECRGVPHHLLGIVDPDDDFTATDFRRDASATVAAIVRRDRLPIIAGGSNSYIKALVNDNVEFRSKYDCCFLWVDVALPVLYSFVSERVDRMVAAGLVEEVRRIFDPEADYTCGIRRAIGVPEMDTYFRAESNRNLDEKAKAELLREAIDLIKGNTCNLARCQLQNILRLQSQLGWDMHRIDATEVFERRGSGGSAANEGWERLVAGPSARIVGRFLYEDDPFVTTISAATASIMGASPAAAVAAATR
ncbi:Adenylate dimethylallyltransferase [Bertholletia excelsa]